MLFARPLHPRAELNRLLREGIQEHGWDVLHVEGPYAGGLVDPELPIPKILSAHDCWTLRTREMLACARTLRGRWYYRLLSYHMRRYERLVFRRFERCVFVSPRDAAAAAGIAGGVRVRVISNGTDTDYYHPFPGDREPATLVFHGHLGFEPNIEAAEELVGEIAPLVRRQVPDAVAHVVGAAPDARVVKLSRHAGVRISADLVDLRSAVSAGTIYVCPVRHGSGLKNKVLEAMAMRLPIVAHPNALVGIECSPGVHLLTAESPEGFAAEIVGLMRDPSRATALADAGRQLVERQYGWDARAREFEELYLDARNVRHVTAASTGHRW